MPGYGEKMGPFSPIVRFVLVDADVDQFVRIAGLSDVLPLFHVLSGLGVCGPESGVVRANRQFAHFVPYVRFEEGRFCSDPPDLSLNREHVLDVRFVLVSGVEDVQRRLRVLHPLHELRARDVRFAPLRVDVVGLSGFGQFEVRAANSRDSSVFVPRDLVVPTCDDQTLVSVLVGSERVRHFCPLCPICRFRAGLVKGSVSVALRK